MLTPKLIEVYKTQYYILHSYLTIHIFDTLAAIITTQNLNILMY